MSQQAQIGKPPQPEKPPPSLSQSYRTIYTFEKREPVSFEGVTFPITEQQFEERVGQNLLSLPPGALITGVSVTEGGYGLTYEVPEALHLGLPPRSTLPWKLTGLVQAQSEQAAEPEPISYYEYVSVKPMGIPGPQQIAWKLAQLEASVMPEYEPEVATAVPVYPEVSEIGYAFTHIPEVLQQWWAGIPSAGEINAEMQKDISGRAYAWTIYDVYDVVRIALLGAATGQAVYGIVRTTMPSVSMPNWLRTRVETTSRIGKEAIKTTPFYDVAVGGYEFGKVIVEPLRGMPSAFSGFVKTMPQIVRESGVLAPISYPVSLAREALLYGKVVIVPKLAQVGMMITTGLRESLYPLISVPYTAAKAAVSFGREAWIYTKAVVAPKVMDYLRTSISPLTDVLGRTKEIMGMYYTSVRQGTLVLKGWAQELYLYPKVILAPKIQGTFGGTKASLSAMASLIKESTPYETLEMLAGYGKIGYIYAKSVVLPQLKEYGLKGWRAIQETDVYKIGQWMKEAVPRGLKQTDVFRWFGVTRSQLQEWAYLTKIEYGLKELPFKIVKPYQGMSITLGRADLPYRGFMGEIPKSLSKSGLTSVLEVSKPIGKIAPKLKATSLLGSSALVSLARSKPATILHGWTGPELPRYKMPKGFAEIGQYQQTYPSTKTRVTMMPKKMEKALVLAGLERPISPDIRKGIEAKFAIEQASQQMQRQLQRQMQKQAQMQSQLPSFEDWLLTPKRRRRGREPLGLFGRYKRFYPVMTGVEVAKLKKIRGLP